ncbi:MAG: glycosyltransferase family 4 protein [Nisaea sp.]|uniref:glycosyltransferase family 4 protein n=1 Tax=Nisaea sp. TaxID=2024842 RepID=UPI001B0E9C1E|nr:glycosyltransferase family 4 protein [Nisaea sp.]MBO6560816.1 glycosyltransferase family 4 protein [Nisaea sp.]
MRVLSVVHNHSSLHPGGTEMMAEGLHSAYRERPGVEARLLAAVDPGLRPGLPGTAITALETDPSIFFFRAPGFDPVEQSRHSLEPLLYDVAWFLRDFRPNIVHIHHFNQFGLELLQLVRKELPRARIYVTLHDYYLICGRDGLLFNSDGERCSEPTPDRCFKCFPDRSPASFAARKEFVLKHLNLADLLIAPSAFLRERFLAWGLPGSRIAVIRNGWSLDGGDRQTQPPDLRNFALFGNLRETKGTLVAIRAFLEAAEASERKSILNIYGSALYQREEFKEELAALVDGAGDLVRMHGRYDRNNLAPALRRAAWVLVPSIWWENAPLVINEAFSFKRPVLCSDIGGMAEAVRDRIDGLHIRAGDVAAWREAIEHVSGNEILWRKLSAGVAPVRTLDEAASDYLALFERRRAA